MTEANRWCPYCQSYAPPDFRYGDKRMTVCPTCGAWFVWPPPTLASIQEHYAKGTAGMPSELREWRGGTAQDKWYEVLARRIASRAPNATSVVDVGAGAAELAIALSAQLPNARVEAWDLFADGVPAHARIVIEKIDLNRLDDSTPRGRTFDVVACVAVIEHVLDPLALLRFLRSITAPGGFAFVVGPEVTSVAHRLLRGSWPYYAPDDHLTLPSLKSIEAAVALSGGGRCWLRRVSVHYSLKYLLRFLRIPVPVPSFADIVLPLPTGAFELVWERS